MSSSPSPTTSANSLPPVRLVTLFDFLVHEDPKIPQWPTDQEFKYFPPKKHSISNTRSFPITTVHSGIHVAEDLTPYNVITDEMWEELQTEYIDPDVPMPPVSPLLIHSEEQVKDRLSASFWPAIVHVLDKLYPKRIYLDADGAAKTINKYKPDRVIVKKFGGSYRVPGDVKISTKFKADWVHSLGSVISFPAAPGDSISFDSGDMPVLPGDHLIDNQFLTVTAQVNGYMRQADSRYGYVITDREIMIIRRDRPHWRLDSNDVFVSSKAIKVSAAIPLSAYAEDNRYQPKDPEMPWTARLFFWWICRQSLEKSRHAPQWEGEEDDEWKREQEDHDLEYARVLLEQQRIEDAANATYKDDTSNDEEEFDKKEYIYASRKDKTVTIEQDGPAKAAGKRRIRER